jgi:hypothetical protein
MIALADSEKDPAKFVILQKTHEYDEQDKRLGMDSIHIQIEGEVRARYGGITSIACDRNTLIISLDEAARTDLNVQGDIEISLVADSEKAREAIGALEEMAVADGISFEKTPLA